VLGLRVCWAGVVVEMTRRNRDARAVSRVVFAGVAIDF
jgi:hypothetical protein